MTEARVVHLAPARTDLSPVDARDPALEQRREALLDGRLGVRSLVNVEHVELKGCGARSYPLCEQRVTPEPVRECPVRVARPRVHSVAALADLQGLDLCRAENEQGVPTVGQQRRYEVRKQPVAFDDHWRVVGKRLHVVDDEREPLPYEALELLRDLGGRWSEPALVERAAVERQARRVLVEMLVERVEAKVVAPCEPERGRRLPDRRDAAEPEDAVDARRYLTELAGCQSSVPG